MSYTVLHVDGPPCRFLIFAADSQEELSELTERGLAKGWLPFADGTEPETGRRSVWLTKPDPA